MSINVYKDGLTGGLQLSIDFEREDDSGHGFRLAGPKFIGQSKRLMRCAIGAREVEEIQKYLKLAVK